MKHLKKTQQLSIVIINPLLHDKELSFSLTQKTHRETKSFYQRYVAKGSIKMSYCNTNEQLADMFTKSGFGEVYVFQGHVRM